MKPAVFEDINFEIPRNGDIDLLEFLRYNMLINASVAQPVRAPLS